MAIKLFADGASLEHLPALASDPRIEGFTTNPSLIARSGVTDYTSFAQRFLEHVSDRPVSFEVVSDDFDDMGRQAHIIASWGDNAYVKIPITNTRGASSIDLIRRLSSEGLKLNITAILSLQQVEAVVPALAESVAGIVSVFAGRIADTGRDPMPIMAKAVDVLKGNEGLELLWASPREILNVNQAQDCGCHIITLTFDLLQKLNGFGRELEDVSLDTVKMFYEDGEKAHLHL